MAALYRQISTEHICLYNWLLPNFLLRLLAKFAASQPGNSFYAAYSINLHLGVNKTASLCVEGGLLICSWICLYLLHSVLELSHNTQNMTSRELLLFMWGVWTEVSTDIHLVKFIRLFVTFYWHVIIGNGIEFVLLVLFASYELDGLKCEVLESADNEAAFSFSWKERFYSFESLL